MENLDFMTIQNLNAHFALIATVHFTLDTTILNGLEERFQH